MSEQSHTPGPWKVYHTTDGRTMLGVGDAEGGGITDANMCLGTWRAGLEQAANARLIAAAPELLAALEIAEPILTEQYEQWTSYTPRGKLLPDGTVDIEQISDRTDYRDACRDRDALATCRAAISKATGAA